MKDALYSLVIVARKSLQATRDDLLRFAEDFKTCPALLEAADCPSGIFSAHGLVKPQISLSDICLSAAEYMEVVKRAFFEDTFLCKYLDEIKRENSTDQVFVEEVGNTRIDVETSWERMQSVIAAKPIESERRAYGLMVGRVQSGKTRNYIGLLFKAFDEGWNTVIILTSNNTALAEQTKIRFENACRSVRCRYSYLDFLKMVPDARMWSPEEHSIGLAQKEPTHLERINSWLRSLGAEKCAQMRLLVIDDESDNATPDTRQTDSAIFSDADVLALSDTVRRSGCEEVADWIAELVGFELDARACELGLSEQGVKDACAEVQRQALAKTSLMTLLGRNTQVSQLLGLNEDVCLPNGQRQCLGERVRALFDMTAIPSHQINWKQLRDLMIYCFDVRPVRSRINHQMSMLFSRPNPDDAYAYRYECMSYVGYTATPYANILNENPNLDPFASDYMYPIQTSRRYFGLNKIFGPPKKMKDDDCNMPVVRTINDLKILNLLRSKYDCPDCVVDVSSDLEVSIVYKEHDDVQVQQDSSDSENGSVDQVSSDDDVEDGDVLPKTEWTTLKNAIAWLFCAASVRRISRKGRSASGKSVEIAHRWTTMLFNVCPEKEFHARQAEWLKAFFNGLANRTSRDAFVALCKMTWEAEVSRFSKEMFDAKFPDYGEVDDYPASWNEVSRELDWFLDRVADDNRVHVIVMNCNPEGEDGVAAFRDDSKRYRDDEDDHIWVVCGGNKISRGLTLDGLVVTYFDRVRSSTCVDTLEQMGRWFGHRKGYELLPRLWMTNDTVIEFKRMAKIEDAMHEELRRNFDAELSPKDKDSYARVMRFGRNLSGRTRAEKRQAAEFGAFNTFNRCSISRKTAVLNALSRFVGDIESTPGHGQLVRPVDEYKSQPGGDAAGSFHAYPYWRDVSKDKIITFLTSLSESAPHGDARLEIDALIREIVACDWDVVISSPDTGDSYCVNAACNVSVNVAASPVTKCKNDLVELSKYSGDNFAFFSGVRTETIVRGEIALITEDIKDEMWDHEDDEYSKDEIEQIIAASEDAGCKDMLPQRLRTQFDLTRMSSMDYKRAVFKKVIDILPHPEYDRPNPILQISLVRPSGRQDLGSAAEPFVVVSYFWPEHDDTQYFWASVGFNDDTGAQPRSTTIASVIRRVLRGNEFLAKKVLLRLVQKELGLDELSDSEFTNALAENVSACQALDPEDTRLGHHVLLSRDWLDDPDGPVPSGSEAACVCKRIEALARNLMEERGMTIPCNQINAMMSRRYPLKLNCVMHENYDELFQDMMFSGALSLISLGTGPDFVEGWYVSGGD